MRATNVSIHRKPAISQETRDRIVLEHLPLVKAIAVRVHEVTERGAIASARQLPNAYGRRPWEAA